MKENFKKFITGSALIIASLLPMKESMAQGNYSQLDKKYNLELVDSQGKEMKDKILIPEKEQNAVKEFLRVANEYSSSVNEADFLNKINQAIVQFSDFKVEIISPLSGKDPIKDKILTLSGIINLTDAHGKVMKKDKFSYAFLKIKNKWTVVGLYTNYIEKYRNLGDNSGYFNEDGKTVLVNGNGGDWLNILKIIKGSKGAWE